MEDDLGELDIERFLSDPLVYQLISDWESEINPLIVADAYYNLVEKPSTRAQWRIQYQSYPLHAKLRIHDKLNASGTKKHYLTARDVLILDHLFNPVKVPLEIYGRALLGLPPTKLNYLLQKAGLSLTNEEDDDDIQHVHHLTDNPIADNSSSATKQESLVMARAEQVILKTSKTVQQQDHAIMSLFNSFQSEITALKAKLSENERQMEKLRSDFATIQGQQPLEMHPKPTTAENSSSSYVKIANANNGSSTTSSTSSTSSSPAARNSSENSMIIPETPIPPKVMRSVEEPLIQPKVEVSQTPSPSSRLNRGTVPMPFVYSDDSDEDDNNSPAPVLTLNKRS